MSSLASVLALGGCGWLGRADETSKPDGILLHGYVSVAGAAAGATGTPCQAPATVPDITAGGSVKVADADGHVIAATDLAGGVLSADGTGFDCNFAFELRNISGSRDSYLILVGDRPAARFATKDLREGKPAVIPVSPSTARSSSPSPAPSLRASSSPS
ncbi:hypothetical protein [Dactylosporangium sp. CA-092794]|uniref:hypothetical protein n=1 Tax=Dactylosporangium sp. CA-092794 TaxID=3239929 RepID=UPI003D929DDD